MMAAPQHHAHQPGALVPNGAGFSENDEFLTMMASPMDGAAAVAACPLSTNMACACGGGGAVVLDGAEKQIGRRQH